MKLDLNEVNFRQGTQLKYRSAPSLDGDLSRLWTKRIRVLRQEVAQRLHGQEKMLEVLILGLITGGHVLLEGQPGLGKSTAINALCETLRIDVVHVQQSGDFIGANLVVVDEINHSQPEFRRTLLSAMQEKEVIFNDQHYYLDLPFVVIATRNPNPDAPPLTLAELDRFMINYTVPFPEFSQELQILNTHTKGADPFQKSLETILENQDLLTLQRLVTSVEIPDEERDFIVKCIASSRVSGVLDGLKEDFQGLSPRATINLGLTSQAMAFLDGDLCVKREHILKCLPLVISHRLRLTREGDTDDLCRQMAQAASA